MAASLSGVRPASSRPLPTWLRASMGFAPHTNGGQPLKRLAIFQWSAETGIYVDVDHHRAGGGRELYTQLRRLTERGYRQAFDGITQPYEPSNGFQRSFGFQACFAAWHESATAGTTWPRCNSICSTLAARMDPLGPDSLTAPGAIRAVKKPSRRHPTHRWFAKVNRGRVVHQQHTLTPESNLR